VFFSVFLVFHCILNEETTLRNEGPTQNRAVPNRKKRAEMIFFEKKYGDSKSFCNFAPK